MTRSELQRKNLERDKLRKPKKHKIFSTLFKTICFLIVAIIIITVVAVIVFHSYLKIAIDSYNIGIDTTRIDYELVPHMYDKNGNLIHMYYGYYDEDSDDFIPTYSSEYIKLQELPDYVYNAFVAIEDETFYTNLGFSPKRLIAAVISYKLKGDSSFGASTITQQLVKLSTGDKSHSPERKSREIGAAIYLNENWDKKKILESYINLAYYGDNCYGISEASKNYFGKEPKDLTITEAATLAALLNKPNGNSPYNGEKSKNALMHRTKLVLDKMLELDFISQTKYNEAIAYELVFMNKDYQYKDIAMKQYISLAMKETLKMVKKYYGLYSTDEAMEMILSGNTKIYTNLDSVLQHKSYDIINNSYPDDIELGYILTSKDGKVLTAITSQTGSNIDHVYSMLRQTGSVIKPLSVYGPAFDLNLEELYSIEIDEPIFVDNWQVTNHDDTYSGAMLIKDAVAYSNNVIAVKVLDKVGLNTSVSYLKKLGISTITDKDVYYPALALGGLSNGISPFEMCQAYNTINNDGVFSKISFISKIEINGITIYPDNEKNRVFSPYANSALKECLRAVTEYGTATRANIPNHTVYSKTGTTNDKVDYWTCGFTDEVTAVIWAGYDEPRTIESIPQGEISEVWKNLVELYYK